MYSMGGGDNKVRRRKGGWGLRWRRGKCVCMDGCMDGRGGLLVVVRIRLEYVSAGRGVGAVGLRGVWALLLYE